MSSAEARPRDRGLTLEDYLAHQRALRTLQQSQPVWIVDDVLGLRYRARLQLYLSPSRHLLLSEDSGQGDGDEYGAAPTVSSASSVVIPLGPACVIESGPSAGSSGECGLRVTFTPTTLTSSTDVEVVASYFVLPITEVLGTPLQALARTWAAVLRSLCQPPRTPALSVSAPLQPAVAERRPHTRHADPSVTASPPHAAAAKSGVVGTSSPPPAARTAYPPAPPSLPVKAVYTTSSSSLNRTPSNPTTTTRTPAPSATSPSTAPEEADHHTESGNATTRGAHHTGNNSAIITSRSSNSAPRPRDPDEPPPLYRALHVPRTDPDVSGKVESDVRLLQLTAALRNRTREAAQLTAHFRSSLSPSRCSPSRSPREEGGSGSTVEVDVPEMDEERPPTMAHISSGLVPALKGFHQLPPIVSSDEDEDEDVDENEGEQRGCDADAGQNTQLLSHAAAGDLPSNGVHGAHTGIFATNPPDSPRPQAPRGGHVCNLGSLGPSCGDEEALKIYNEIHGSHSTSASSPLHPSASTGSEGNASSFPSSAYDTQDAVEHGGSEGTTGPSAQGRLH